MCNVFNRHSWYNYSYWGTDKDGIVGYRRECKYCGVQETSDNCFPERKNYDPPRKEKVVETNQENGTETVLDT